MTFRAVLPLLIMTTLVMTGSLVQASQVTVEVEDAGFAERGLWETQPTQPTAPTNNVACSSGLTAVKFGAGVICAQSADGGDNIANGNQIADGATSKGGKASSGPISTSGGQANGGTNSITGRRSLLSSGGPGQKPPSNPPPTNNIACSSGFTAVKSGAGVVCIQSADGGDNIGNGNQVLDGASSKWGTASSDSISTSGGQANGGTNSITGRRSLLSSGGSGGSGGSSGGPGQKPPSNPAPSNNVACSTGLVAVKFGVGTLCVQQADGGVNALNGNQIADSGGESTNGGQANGGSNTIAG